MQSWTEERRQFARVAEGLCAWVSFANTPAAYSTLTIDVGTGGAQLSVLRRVRVGEPVLILLQLHGGEVECRGKVCWAKATGMGASIFGVQFVGLTADGLDRLEALVVQETSVSASA